MTKYITHLPNYLVGGKGGGGHSSYTVYSCWETGSAGGYRVTECKEKCELMLCEEPIWYLGPMQVPHPITPQPQSLPPHSPPRFTLRITLQLALANRCSRLGCRPQHARKQTLIVGLPSIISSPLLFPPPLLYPGRPGEQSRGPNLST